MLPTDNTRENDIEQDKDYNYDRIVSAQAMINPVQVDMLVTLHRGKINEGMRDRMVEFLRYAADDLAAMGTD